MSTTANNYIDQSLAGSGLAVIDGQIACMLRPDMWSSGLAAGSDFAPHNYRPTQRKGIKTFRAMLAGRDKPVTVMARSSDRLALRIEWVTGYQVLDLYAEEEVKGVTSSVEKVVKPRKWRAPSGDVHANLQTKEPGRTCNECSNLSAGRTCIKSKESGIEQPDASVPRRCIAFTPPFVNFDPRKGLQIWPELSAVVNKA